MKKWCLKYPIDIGNRKDFTLIELVVVLAVLTILSGLGLFAFLNFIDDAKFATTKQTLTSDNKQCEANKELRKGNIPDVIFTNFENSDKPDCRNNTIAANINESVA